MNEAELNAACLYRTGEEIQIKLYRDVAMDEAEPNTDCLHRE